MVILTILSIIIIFLIDTFLIGIAFQALKNRFEWSISQKKCFIILLLIFAVFDNYFFPLLYALDLRVIVGNKAIAEFLELNGAIHFLELFDPGIFEFLTYSFQAFLAGILGPKILNKSAIEM